MSNAQINIDKFLGLNLSLTGDTNLLVGELAECTNAKITQEYKIRKREGYQSKINFGNNKPIQGQWSGTVGGKELVLIANNGKLYEFERGEFDV